MNSKGHRAGPVAGHAKVHVERPSIVEHQSLVLRLLLHRHDRSPGERVQHAARDTPAQCRMQQLDDDDLALESDAAQATRGSFDFRKLGHSDERE